VALRWLSRLALLVLLVLPVLVVLVVLVVLRSTRSPLRKPRLRSRRRSSADSPAVRA